MAVPTLLDWDAGNLAKCQSQGVSIQEIEQLFRTGPFTGPDESHSFNEDRFVAVGKNHADRPIFVVFTLRVVDGVELVRPVLARYMHRKEIRKYDQLWRSKDSPTSDR